MPAIALNWCCTLVYATSNPLFQFCYHNLLLLLPGQFLLESATVAAVAAVAVSVVDLEIFRGGFSFTKTPAKLEVKTKKKKKVFTSFLDYLFLAAAPKLTQ